MATYVPEVARLTYDTGSNSRLRRTERGMTEDEHNRGHGPTPLEDRRIFCQSCPRPIWVSREWDPIEGGIEPSEPSERFRHPPRLPSGILRCAHRATSRPLSNGTRTSAWIYLPAAPGKRRHSSIEGSTARPTRPPSERKNEGRNYKTRKNLIDPCRERARGLPRTMGTGTMCKEHATYPSKYSRL